MSGHSKWASIKHKKGAADAKRGQLFTRIIKEITVAARHGGGDPDSNPRLRTVIGDAKAANMPADNIKRAIRRGTGEEPGVEYEEITYEAYGPGGAAMLIEVVTDNTNRAVGEIRHMLSKHGGNLGTTNSVAWMFDKRGYIVIEKAGADEEALMTAAIDAGADDFEDDGDHWEVVSRPGAHDHVLSAIKAVGGEVMTAQIAMLPKNQVKVEGKQAQQLLKLMDILEDQDDVHPPDDDPRACPDVGSADSTTSIWNQSSMRAYQSEPIAIRLVVGPRLSPQRRNTRPVQANHRIALPSSSSGTHRHFAANHPTSSTACSDQRLSTLVNPSQEPI